MQDSAESMKPLLRFLTAGSVDDGKSTLIGRLLHDTKGVYEDQLDNVRQASKTSSTHTLDLAFITDGLRAERERGITIDVAYRYFSTARRKFIIADTPGHEQYTRNMATGASTASLAIILIDARKGVLAQTRRHACISWLLGIREVAVAVNKMDLIGYDQAAFDEIRAAFLAFSRELGFPDPCFIPLSALVGDNVVARTARMLWYDGPCLLDYLETAPIQADLNLEDLRIPVQTVIRAQNGFRGYAGPVVSGLLRAGDDVVVLPSGIRTRIRTLASCDGERAEAFPPLAVTLELADEVDAGRGSLLVAPDRMPTVSRHLEATLVWMAEKPLALNQPYVIRHLTRQVLGEVVRLKHRLDVETLQHAPGGEMGLNDIGDVEIETHKPLFFDAYRRNRATGSFILIDPSTNHTVACGMILGPRETGLRALSSAEAPTTTAPPAPGPGGMTLWFTGLPSAGKTTLCEALHARLKARGLAVEMLDGDVVRRHLSKGLGFSREDRDENIRRIGFVASLLTRNGVVVLVSAISPYRAIRDEVRAMIGSFVEVYVNAPLEVCRQRDVKGLYGKAQRGELKGLTGVDDPYEPPLAAEIECKTDRESIETCVERVLNYLRPPDS